MLKAGALDRWRRREGMASSRALNEAGIIAVIREMAGGPFPGLEVPIGDDAAAFHFTGGTALLTVDSLYEGVHFNLDTHHLSDVGWKAAAAGVSDIAAMGGEPSCALLSIGFEAAPVEREVRDLLGGLLEMLSSCHCALAGGDVSRSMAGLSLTVTVAGTPPAGGPVPRGGALQGDVIGLTGYAGDSAAGLFLLERGPEGMRGKFPGLVEAHLRPRPGVREGRLLAAAGARAMEDTSDGLAADLGHICEESGLGCEIREDAVPLSEDLRRLAGEVGVEPIEWALSGGEDYELIFATPPGVFDESARSLGDHGIRVSRLGVMTGREGGCVLVARGGGMVDLEGGGFDHFD